MASTTSQCIKLIEPIAQPRQPKSRLYSRFPAASRIAADGYDFVPRSRKVKTGLKGAVH